MASQKLPSVLTDGPGHRTSVVGTPFTRLTIIVPRKLQKGFLELATSRERTVSAELRKLMQDAIDRDRKHQDDLKRRREAAKRKREAAA